MKYIICLSFLFSLTLSVTVVPWDVQECQSDNKLVEFNAATLDIVPAKGTDNTITLYGSSLDHVEFNQVKCKTKLSGVLVSVIDIPNTDVYDEGDPITFVYKNTFPSFTPSGNYLVNFEFYDIDGVVVGCSGIKFSLK